MQRRAFPRIITIVAVLALSGCFTLSLRHAMVAYYSSGPDVALEVHDWIKVADEDRPLAAREQAMALLELGRYDEVISTLKPVATDNQAHAGPGPISIRSDEGLFLGENYERIMVPVVTMCAHLALQQSESAADWADQTLALARDAHWSPAQFPSAWVLSALSFEGAGRLGAARSVLYELMAADTQSNLATVVEHLSQADPRGRSLVAVLLLGGGPHKSRGAVSLPNGKEVSWPFFERRQDPPILVGEVRIDKTTSVRSIVVEDLWTTARTGLAARYDQLLELAADDGATEQDVDRLSATLGVSDLTANRIAAAFDEPQEMLGWWSLPATIQVIRTAVTSDAEWCDLLVLDISGGVHWEEGFELPTEWQDGPLFVVRRVP